MAKTDTQAKRKRQEEVRVIRKKAMVMERQLPLLEAQGL